MINNPVLFKELRLTMRTGRPFWAMFGYVLVLGVVALLAFPRGPVTPENNDAGRVLFWWVTAFQFILVCLLTPALAGTTLAVEKEQRTMEMLLISALTPREIVWGKFLSSLANVCLPVVCSLPLTAISLMVGGVSPTEIFVAYVSIFLTAVVAAGISVFSSAEETRTHIALLRAYISAAVLVMIALQLSWAGWLWAPIVAGIFLSVRLWRRIKGWSIALGFLVCVGLWFLLFQLMMLFGLLNFLLGALLCSALLVYPFLLLSERAVLKPPPLVLSRREQVAQSVPQRQWVNQPIPFDISPMAAPPAPAARRAPARRRKRDPGVYAEENFIPDRVNPVSAKELRTSFFGRQGLLWKTAVIGLAIGVGGLGVLFLFIAFIEWMDFQFGSQPLSLTDIYSNFLVTVRWLFVLVGMAYLGLVMAMSTAAAAVTFSREREQRSLDLLVITPLSSQEIVRGKFYTVVHAAAFLAAVSFPLALLCAAVGAVPWWVSLIFIASQTVYSVASVAVGLLCSLSASSSRRSMAMSIGALMVSLMGGVITALALGSYRNLPTLLLSAFPLDAFWTAVGWLCDSPPRPVLSEAWLLSLVWYSVGGLLLLWMAGALFERWFRKQGVT